MVPAPAHLIHLHECSLLCSVWRAFLTFLHQRAPCFSSIYLFVFFSFWDYSQPFQCYQWHWHLLLPIQLVQEILQGNFPFAAVCRAKPTDTKQRPTSWNKKLPFRGLQPLKFLYIYYMPLWRCLWPWIESWAAWSDGGQPAHGRAVRTGWSFRLASNPTILWFCDDCETNQEALNTLVSFLGRLAAVH